MRAVLASGFGTGYLPFAPGTWASLLALPLAVLLARWPALYAAVVAVVLVGGAFLARDRERAWGVDASRITIDEIAGMLVTLLFVPITPKTLVFGFILFRAFDILKLPFVRRAERLGAGFGVMADDLIAGICANLCLRIPLLA